MQQPTRYYITKSGEESTVRSVRVARSAIELDNVPDADIAGQADQSGSSRERTPRDHGFSVKSRIRGAMRKRGLVL